MSARRFRLGLGAATVLGLVVRLVAVAYQARHHGPPPPDPTSASWFWLQSNLLADGHGFADPSRWYRTGAFVHSADQPPLFTIVLGVAAWLGAGSPTALRVVGAIVSAAGVPAVALVARRVGGPIPGLAAAVLVAVLPNLWFDGPLLAPESLLVPVLGGVLWCALDLVEGPSLPRAAALGAAIGLATLCRVEAVWLLLLLVAPLAAWSLRDRGARARLRWSAAALLGAAVVIAPWAVASRADLAVPLSLSGDAGATLASANCELTYRGDLLGTTDPRCIAASDLPITASPRQLDRERAVAAMTYLRSHWPRFVAVVAPARVGRAFGLFRPTQTNDLAELYEHRGGPIGQVGTWASVALLALAAVGAVHLARRARRAWVPLVSLIALSAGQTVLAGGLVRYRVSADVALVVLASLVVSGRPAGPAADASSA